MTNAPTGWFPRESFDIRHSAFVIRHLEPVPMA
jgi:hypothetical protein